MIFPIWLSFPIPIILFSSETITAPTGGLGLVNPIANLAWAIAADMYLLDLFSKIFMK